MLALLKLSIYTSTRKPTKNRLGTFDTAFPLIQLFPGLDSVFKHFIIPTRKESHIILEGWVFFSIYYLYKL